MVMQILEGLGVIAIIGLIFTYESRNHGFSSDVTALGQAVNSAVRGIGPG